MTTSEQRNQSRWHFMLRTAITGPGDPRYGDLLSVLGNDDQLLRAEAQYLVFGRKISSGGHHEEFDAFLQYCRNHTGSGGLRKEFDAVSSGHKQKSADARYRLARAAKACGWPSSLSEIPGVAERHENGIAAEIACRWAILCSTADVCSGFFPDSPLGDQDDRRAFYHALRAELSQGRICVAPEDFPDFLENLRRFTGGIASSLDSDLDGAIGEVSKSGFDLLGDREVRKAAEHSASVCSELGRRVLRPWDETLQCHLSCLRGLTTTISSDHVGVDAFRFTQATCPVERWVLYHAHSSLEISLSVSGFESVAVLLFPYLVHYVRAGKPAPLSSEPSPAPVMEWEPPPEPTMEEVVAYLKRRHAA